MPHVVIVGGGIAGMSAAHYLAPHCSVTVVEREPTLTAHSTGRSAAQFIENYGHASVRPLNRASRGFFDNPPPELADVPLLSPRGILTVGNSSNEQALVDHWADAQTGTVPVHRLTPEEAVEHCPVLRPDNLVGAVWEPDAPDMDVGAIHQAFLRGTRAAGGQIETQWGVTNLSPAGNGWQVETNGETLHADVVVNAAGAWCDVVATMAGVSGVGLQPMRRTAFMVTGPAASEHWPLVAPADFSYYFKPDGSQLLCSLADETPVQPCDVKPEELDIALAIDRINKATTLGIRSVRSQWAGLRSFVPDRGMVIGFEPRAPGFFWLAGQGGWGIQTAPAAGMLTADLVLGQQLREALATQQVDVAALSPARLR